MSEFELLGLEHRVEPQVAGDDVAGEPLAAGRDGFWDGGGDDDAAPPPADEPPDAGALLDGLRSLCAELHGDVVPGLRGAANENARRLGARARQLSGMIDWFQARARHAVEHGGGEHTEALAELAAEAAGQRAAVGEAIAAAPAPHPDDFANPHAAEAVEAATGGAGDGLPPPLRGKLEAATGADLGDVRVHSGPATAAFADAYDARAVAVGQDIHLGGGENVDGDDGEWLLAHEVAHTVQQRGAAPAAAAKPRHAPVVVSEGEAEADAFADAVVAGAAVPRLHATSPGAATQKKGAHKAKKTKPAEAARAVGGYAKAPPDQQLSLSPARIKVPPAEVAGGSSKAVATVTNPGKTPITIGGIAQVVTAVGGVARPIGDFVVVGLGAGQVVPPGSGGLLLVVTFRPLKTVADDLAYTTRRSATALILDVDGRAVAELELDGAALHQGANAGERAAGPKRGDQGAKVGNGEGEVIMAGTGAKEEAPRRREMNIADVNGRLDLSRDEVISADELRGLDCTVWSEKDWAAHMALDRGGYGVDRATEAYIHAVEASGYAEGDDAAAREVAQRSKEGDARLAAEKAKRRKLPLEDRIALYMQHLDDSGEGTLGGRDHALVDGWADYLSAAEWRALQDRDPYFAKKVASAQLAGEHADDWQHLRTSDMGEVHGEPISGSTHDEYYKKRSTAGLEMLYDEQFLLPIQGALLGPAQAFGPAVAAMYAAFMDVTMIQAAYEGCVADGGDLDRCMEVALTLAPALAHGRLMNAKEEPFVPARGGHGPVAGQRQTSPAPKPNQPKLIARAAAKAGMQLEHVTNLAARAIREKHTIIVRASNAKSLGYHADEGARPKPTDVAALNTAKDGPNAGLVVKPANPTPAQAAEIRTLEENGWSFDADGVLRDPDGLKIHGDYDLQGVYKKRPDGTQERVDMNDKRLQAGMNRDIDPDREMFQHGANDDYKVKDADGKQKMGRQPGADETFLVAEDDGTVQTIDGTAELQEYYAGHGMEWPYHDTKAR